MALPYFDVVRLHTCFVPPGLNQLCLYMASRLRSESSCTRRSRIEDSSDDSAGLIKKQKILVAKKMLSIHFSPLMLI